MQRLLPSLKLTCSHARVKKKINKSRGSNPESPFVQVFDWYLPNWDLDRSNELGQRLGRKRAGKAKTKSKRQRNRGIYDACDVEIDIEPRKLRRNGIPRGASIGFRAAERINERSTSPTESDTSTRLNGEKEICTSTEPRSYGYRAID